MIRASSVLTGQQALDFGFERAAFAARHDQPERLHEPADLVGQLGRDLDQSGPRGHQRADQHAVIALHPHLAVEADLGQMGQAIGIVGVGFVRRHVEGGLGMAGIDADRRQPFGAAAHDRTTPTKGRSRTPPAWARAHACGRPRRSGSDPTGICRARSACRPAAPRSPSLSTTRQDRYTHPWLFSVRCLGPASSREPVSPSYRGTTTRSSMQ